MIRLRCIPTFCLSLLVTACVSTDRAPAPVSAVEVYAVRESVPVSSRGDAADDPAIWVHATDISASRILGTDKNYGLEVYDLQGARVQSIPAGRVNNVDLRRIEGSANWSGLAAASNRTTNTISLFAIDHAGALTWLQDSEIATGLTEPYGLCMFANAAGLQVFVNDTDGRYQQWLLQTDWATADALPRVTATLAREFIVTSQPEGCVADDANERLFVGVENEGIRVVPANHTVPVTQQTLADIDGEILVADVEGMSLALEGDAGYLIASSQGNYSYAVYDRAPPHRYRGSFVVVGNLRSGIDSADETDGLDVSTLLVTPDFPEGLLVLQDGYNTLPARAQNFKFVSWREVKLALAL